MIEAGRRNGLPAAELDRLAAAPPKVAKEWAEAQGIDPERFVDEVPDVVLRAQPQPGGRDGSAFPVGAPAAGGAAGAAGAGAVGGEAGPGAGGSGPTGGGRGQASQSEVQPAWSREGWCTPELRGQIASAIAQQGAHRDERSLLDGQPDRVQTLGSRGGDTPEGGTNLTRRVELDNGVVGYFKPFDGVDSSLAYAFGQDSAQQSIHEVAAWRLAERMGPPWSEVVPPVVVREFDGEIGSFAMERPGKPGVYEPWGSPEWREAALFDSLIGQQDRHPMNYLVAGDRLALIDHGYSFARSGDMQNFSWFVEHRATTDPTLSHSERQVLAQVAESPDLLGVHDHLEPDRAAALKARARSMLETGRITKDY